MKTFLNGNAKMLMAMLAGAVAAAAVAGEVKIKEDSIVLPTYAPGGYDKTPLFYTGRVYQGAQGRVYPYPMQDVLHDEKIDETYKYLTMENDWFHVGMLPEHGGHLLNFTDKETGFETFYRQHVIKPALIGMLGAWISGGVEWNFPHHHRATTAMPIDWRLVENKDGSKTIWFGETELRRRLKWTIGLSLLPDRAVLRAENVFMNRQPWIESMIYWANVSVHCGDDYQIQFPPSMHLGFDHHKNYWTSYPIGPRKEELELLPSQRSKYADDISGTMDLSWWRNFTIESRSIFGMDPDNAFMAGYDHKKNMGTAHVSNRHITVGKKFFLWGNFPEAHVWDTVLTDNDGPYLELMVGCWSDNQPDYSWIAPYETRKVEQYWFPVKGIGGVKNVTIDGAVNVDRVKPDELLVGFHSTRVLKGCTVKVSRKSRGSRESRGSRKSRESGESGEIFTEKNISIGPNTPWCKTIKVEPGVADQEFTATIADANGKVFLSYTPVGPDPHDPLPPKVENPKPPKEYTSAELAYEVGLRLDQFQNGLIDPEPYYKRALEIDPDYTKANLAMGVRLAKNGSYAEAKPYLERAVARATQNHTRALDAAPEYYLALVERGLGNLKRAEDLFWRCTWRLTHKKESYVEIARIAALRGDWQEALARIDDALALGQDEAKLWTMKGIFLRKLVSGGVGEWRSGGIDSPTHNSPTHNFKSALDRALTCDPLEYWAVVEKAFSVGSRVPRDRNGRAASPLAAAEALASAEKNRGLKAQQLLECISDYWGIGCYDEVIALCDAALAKAATEKPYRTEGPRLPLSDTIAACDSYKNALFGYFKGAAELKLVSGGVEELVSGGVDSPTHNSPTHKLAAFAAANAMPTDYCFPNRLEEEEVLKMAAAFDGRAACPQAAADGALGTTRPTNANTWYYLGCCEWNHDRKEAALADWKKCVELNPRHALALRCIGFGLSHPGTYFTNTGIPSGVPSKEAYEYYLKSLEADPGNFRTLDEAGKLAERLNIPAPKRLVLMEKYKSTVYKYDACVLRLAYTYNAVGRYAEAHEILTTRRFHVWEGADGLLAPFVESCIGLGKAAMAKGDHKTALKYFEESTTYPANLQAGRPGDAGTEPKSRYLMAQCKKALGDEAGYKAELENSLKGWIHAGEMDYWRVKALRELGRDGETAPLIAELKAAIKELETPAPVIINAYAKFAGDNSAMERAAKAREKAGELRKLLKEIECCPSADTTKDLSGTWRVTGENLSGEVRLPGTLADARLGRHMTAADWAADTNRASKGALTREYQYRGKAVYEREIELTADEARYPLELVLERVMLHSELAIDGKTIGSCDSLAVEHVYPIPQELLKPGRHRITLTLDNSNRYNFTEWAHSYGPVMQSVWHGVVGKIALRRQSPLREARVFASWPANKKLTVELPEKFEVKEGCVSLSRREGRASSRPRTGQSPSLPLKHTTREGRASSRPTIASIKPSPYRKGFNIVELALDSEPEPWSEHHPNLYTLTIRDAEADFTHTIRFGFRTVAAHDHALWINGAKWFMRGNLDCCHFPLTGAPDTTKAWWLDTLRRLRDEDGINTIRFHSWTPPQAAFDAADELGMFFAVEAGIWVDRWHKNFDKVGFGKPIDGFVKRELKAILETRANSPAFISLALGNEMGGSNFETMGKWLNDCKAFDPGRLYFATTARSLSPADDYVATHVYPGIGAVRGRIKPSTDWDYEDVYSRTDVPVVAHEIGQWPIYVDWEQELPRYTGVLRPYNLEHYRNIAEKSGTKRFWPRFRMASANLNRLMYKDEVESFMRTPSCAGLQLLSAQDFTGQFEAMIGWRDSFYDLKTSVRGLPPFRDVFNETPHLARFEKYCWSAGETYKAKLVVRNVTEQPISEGTEFKYSISDGMDALVASAFRLTQPINSGEIGMVGEMSLPLTDDMAGRKFILHFGKNTWPFWVFGRAGRPRPAEAARSANAPYQILETSSFTNALAVLAKGGRVLYTGKTAQCAKSHFKPVYWSTGHFRRANAELSSLGYCIRGDHPALRGFPTEDWADWQWYNLVEGGLKHSLADLVGSRVPRDCGRASLPDCDPIIMPVGDLHYSTPMGTLFELKVGAGRLMICGLNLSDKSLPEVRTVRNSILSYMESDAFNPALSIDPEKFKEEFVPMIDGSKLRPKQFADAPVYIAAAVELDAAERSVPWKPALDMAELSQGGYTVAGEGHWGSWRDSTGSFWHGKKLAVTLTGTKPVNGTLHVRFRDPNRNNRSGRGTCEGRPFTVPKHQDAKDGIYWAKLPIMREDALDGKIELTCEALTGPNLMIDRIVITEDK